MLGNPSRENWFVFPQSIVHLFKPIRSPEILSRDSRARPGSIVLTEIKDAASIWATGRTWFQIPRIAKVTFTGVLPRGVTGKDVIVSLCGLFSKDEVLNHAIEFTGLEETMRSLPVDARLTIANMTTGSYFLSILHLSSSQSRATNCLGTLCSPSKHSAE